jgi:hypothetical protein
MEAANMPAHESLEPLPSMIEQPISGILNQPAIEVSSGTVRVHQVTIDRPAIAAYLAHIAPDKLEIALVHALEVGVTELGARRERFKK